MHDSSHSLHCDSLRKQEWASLDARPLPAWYDDAKLGIFVHWGVYSVPSYGVGPAEWFLWFWQKLHSKDVEAFMRANYRPGFSYADFAPQFRAELFQPDRWADVLHASGAKYVVFTSKHAEGFANWPSKYSWNWNSVDTGPHRDLVGDLAAAVRKKKDMKFGVYYSLQEWTSPLLAQDEKNHFKTDMFPKKKILPELYDVVRRYRPEVIFADDPVARSDYYGTRSFLAWLYNTSPVKDTVVVNDRWGSEASCKHGGYWNCGDQYHPQKVVGHKWEMALMTDKISWGYRRNAVLDDYLTAKNLTRLLAETVSCGGNLLVNIGPTHDGRILPLQEERLRQLGAWLRVNGQAIYRTRPWTTPRDPFNPDVWYTQSKANHTVYAIVLEWPADDKLTLGGVRLGSHQQKGVLHTSLLGYGAVPWRGGEGGAVEVDLSVVRVSQLPCPWAWVVALTGV